MNTPKSSRGGRKAVGLIRSLWRRRVRIGGSGGAPGNGYRAARGPPCDHHLYELRLRRLPRRSGLRALRSAPRLPSPVAALLRGRRRRGDDRRAPVGALLVRRLEVQLAARRRRRASPLLLLP